MIKYLILNHLDSCSSRRARLDLGLDGGGLLAAGGHDGEAADALAVQAHVLGVRLAGAQLVAVIQENADRLRVARAVPARKALRGFGTVSSDSCPQTAVT